MKKGIHPKYVESTITCACGNVIPTRSIKPLLKVELCSRCHPFFTGQQRIVDTGGKVERFMRRLEAAAASKKPAGAGTKAAEKPEEAPTGEVTQERSE